MPRPRTWIVVAAVAVVLVLAALLLGPRLVGEARLRSEAESRLTALLGREVRIGGPVRISTGTTIELDVTDVTIARDAGARLPTAAGATDGRAGPDTTSATQPLPPFARIARVRASVAAASLLRGPIRIGRVHVEGAHVYLAVGADGRGNWEGLGASSGDPAGSTPVEWVLDGVTVERSSLHWSDARAGSAWSLDDWSADVGRVALPTPFDVKTSFQVRDVHGPRGRASVVARVTADLDAKRYAMDALTVEGVLAREPSGGTGRDDAPAGPTALPVKFAIAHLDYDGRAATASLRELVADVAGLQLRADGAATDLSSTPRIAATLTTNTFEPRATLQTLGVALPPMQGPGALARAEVRARLAGGTDALSLDGLDATLDDTRLTGRASRAPGTGWTLDLAADRLAVDRYLKPAKLRDKSPVLLPTDLLRSLDVQGTLRVGELVASGVRLKNVTIDLGHGGTR